MYRYIWNFNYQWHIYLNKLGLSIDYRQNRLYFSNMGFEEYDGVLRSWHTIEMVDLDTKKRRTIVTSLEKPRAVVVDSDRR